MSLTLDTLPLHSGRPADSSGRPEREMRTYDHLDRLGIPYERLDHEPAMTMEVCAAIDRSLGATICKNLFLCNRQRTRHYLLMMPGGKKFLTKDLSAQIGSARLSFAGPEAMLEYLDIEPGSVSVMGLINDPDCHVTLLIDKDILTSEMVGCHPCVNTSSLRLRVDDLLNRFLPSVGHSPIFVTLPDHTEEPKC